MERFGNYIVVKSGDKEKHHTKISKNDFLKPGKH